MNPFQGKVYRGFYLGLWVVLLLPVWIEQYPPMWDYPTHLLEAQILAHYSDPSFSYQQSYLLHPGWVLRSNATFQLLVGGLGRFMPVPLAGRLVLTLVVTLLLKGLGDLLQRSGNQMPWILLAPILIYNFTFTGGFVNFNLGIGIGLYIFSLYLRRLEGTAVPPRLSTWLLLQIGVLMLVLYITHLIAWAFIFLSLLVYSSILPAGSGQLEGRGFALRRWQRNDLPFIFAPSGAIPILLVWQPRFGLGALLLIGLVWAAQWGWQAVKPKPAYLIAGGLLLIPLWLVILRFANPVISRSFPSVGYFPATKIKEPFTFFTLPSQYHPIPPWLVSYDLLLDVLLVLLIGLIAWGVFRRDNALNLSFILLSVVFCLVFVFLPNRYQDQTLIDLRALLFVVLFSLMGLRFSRLRPLPRRLLASLMGIIFVLSVMMNCLYSLDYQQKTQQWDQQLQQVRPARNLLVFLNNPAVYKPQGLAGWVIATNTGSHYLATYTIKFGGFLSRTFSNGPVGPRADLPTYNKYWYDAANTEEVTRLCASFKQQYDAILFWEQIEPYQKQALKACFGKGQTLNDFTLWRDGRTNP